MPTQTSLGSCLCELYRHVTTRRWTVWTRSPAQSDVEGFHKDPSWCVTKGRSSSSCRTQQWRRACASKHRTSRRHSLGSLNDYQWWISPAVLEQPHPGTVCVCPHSPEAYLYSDSLLRGTAGNDFNILKGLVLVPLNSSAFSGLAPACCPGLDATECRRLPLPSKWREGSVHAFSQSPGIHRYFTFHRCNSRRTHCFLQKTHLHNSKKFLLQVQYLLGPSHMLYLGQLTQTEIKWTH